MTVSPLVLYCKSYRTDLLRTERLARSVRSFNAQGLPFHLSVPQADLPLFRERLAGLGVELHADEDIVRTSPRIRPEAIAAMPGSRSQQVVKSEFWRLGLCDSYVCLDSDAYFIRPFGAQDFLAADGTPYTVMDEAHDLLEDALRAGRKRVVDDFAREADLVQGLFGRQGRRYSFGPFPLVWHRAVWQSLDEQYLQPRAMSFADAVQAAPIESRWYGESLLAFRAIPLVPCQALFKVYHYAWQYDSDRRKGVQQQELARLYCGVICQSAWERHMDWPREGGSAMSRMARRLRRRLGRM